MNNNHLEKIMSYDFLKSNWDHLINSEQSKNGSCIELIQQFENRMKIERPILNHNIFHCPLIMVNFVFFLKQRYRLQI